MSKQQCSESKREKNDESLWTMSREKRIRRKNAIPICKVHTKGKFSPSISLDAKRKKELQFS